MSSVPDLDLYVECVVLDTSGAGAAPRLGVSARYQTEPALTSGRWRHADGARRDRGSWHALEVSVADWRAVLAADDGNELQPAASEVEIGRVEALLGAVLPADLCGLYLVSDGVFDKAGQWFVVWPLAQIVERNQRAWAEEEHAERGRLVGFGDDGTGTAFCVPRNGSAGVFAWNPIDERADRLADSVVEFWTGWCGGVIRT